MTTQTPQPGQRARTMARSGEPVAARVERAVRFLRHHVGLSSPRAAIVLGTGLGGLGEQVDPARRLAFEDIPGYPATGVAGHRGEMICGELEGIPVLLQSGRYHLYEGHDAVTATLPIRVAAALGARTLIVTNAAGGIRTTFRPPLLMLMVDHVNLTFRNPLVGPVLGGEDRFPDMSAPYDPELMRIARSVALAERIPLEEGVYAGLLGPSYETPAEIRMLRRLGADAVGMSTVPEVIVARARGMRCLGISSITNLAADLSPTALAHAEVLEAGRVLSRDLERIVRGVLRENKAMRGSLEGG